MIGVAKLSPMMEQYVATKEKYKDCILFYRLGDFYEMFFDDAILASKELEITLTEKTAVWKSGHRCVGFHFMQQILISISL